MFVNLEKVAKQCGIIAGMKVADLGAGVGHLSLALAKIVGPSGKVYAVEIQQNLLKTIAESAAREHFLNVEGVWGDIDDLHGSKLKDMSLDGVFLANVFFQLEKKEESAKEAFRILKSKGVAVVVDWSDSFSGMGPQPQHVVKEGDARALFERAGFQYVRSVETGPHHWGILMRKP